MLRLIIAFAAQSSISSVNPLQKAALFLLPVVLLGFSSGASAPAAYCVASALSMHIFFRSPLRIVATFTSGMLIFTLLTSLALLADYGPLYVAALVAKSVAGMLSILLFSLHTPMDDLLCSLSKFGALKDLCDIAKSTLRFLILIEDELRVMTFAAKSRNGFGSFKKSISTTGKIAGLLFVNTMRRWGDIKCATDSRCYKGIIPYAPKNFKFSKALLLLGIIYNAGLLATLFM
ncbi:ABC-type cobalt transport system, permease component CbiQ (plasmid) [Peptoclostridium acidaminophilum DSM 3953]|uniref:ABC-type cobalt transport system, permease component CbiQ n=1 Tax=Peptoclostridium acidaminophilum DSM 3953 TaxID=1286171 RepID=W8T761_PEPAC|nr:CbiQ family ECF transporter T component [Peptoclostridium acidaminophilum]AHM57574.1 ABC-type cobalt transport system, permease component CbiQ [Peptoclostridium acidaminophilum DSM 3953]